MECPKCNGTEITAIRISFPSIRGATNYEMGCKLCGHKWKRMRGHRRRPKTGQDNEWGNVEYIENGFEQKRREEREKVDRGECPKCGGKLQVVETGKDERLVKFRIDCLNNCGLFRVSGSATIGHFEKQYAHRAIKE